MTTVVSNQLRNNIRNANILAKIILISEPGGNESRSIPRPLILTGIVVPVFLSCARHLSELGLVIVSNFRALLIQPVV